MSVIMMIILVLVICPGLLTALVAGVALLAVHISNRKKQTVPINESPAPQFETNKSLAAVLKEHRIYCNMTQEYVAEQLEVSRQAVSKWENGTSDPSTSNLIALARLYQISPDELLKEVKK